MPRINIDYVFWDFDGIINRSYEDGRYGWCKHFERDLGVQFDSFSSSVFGDQFNLVLRGKIDLLYTVAERCETA